MTEPKALLEPLPPTPGLILPLFIESIRILATTTNFHEVSQPLAGLNRFHEEDWESEGWASFRVEDGSIEEISFSFARSESDEPASIPPQVAAIEAIFDTNTVRLGDLEEILGPWYRDPPDGDEASLATAYFNARLIAPSVSFFLLALTKAPYSKTLLQSEIVSNLAVTWSDDRYGTENRPW